MPTATNTIERLTAQCSCVSQYSSNLSLLPFLTACRQLLQQGVEAEEAERIPEAYVYYLKYLKIALEYAPRNAEYPTLRSSQNETLEWVLRHCGRVMSRAEVCKRALLLQFSKEEIPGAPREDGDAAELSQLELADLVHQDPEAVLFVNDVESRGGLLIRRNTINLSEENAQFHLQRKDEGFYLKRFYSKVVLISKASERSLRIARWLRESSENLKGSDFFKIPDFGFPPAGQNPAQPSLSEEGRGALLASGQAKEKPPEIPGKPGSFRDNFSTQSKLRPIARVCGFKNLGNTCYANATLQAVLSVPAILGELLEQTSPFLGTMQQLLRDMESREANPSAVLNAFARRCSKSFAANPSEVFRQHDAHDFLLQLVAILQADLKENQIYCRGTPEFERYYRQFQSPITRFLFGTTKSEVSCLLCDFVSDSFEVCCGVGVEVPAQQPHCTLDRCLQGFCSEEFMRDSWYSRFSSYFPGIALAVERTRRASRGCRL